MGRQGLGKFATVMGDTLRPPVGRRWFRDPRLRTLFYQVAALAALAVLGIYLFGQVSARLSERNIQTGFGFLDHQAGFVISQSFIDYEPTDSFARAFAAGLTNTMVVSASGMLLATLLGFVVGVARLADNVLVAALARAYVEVLRGVPLLLYLFLIYGLIIGVLPPVASAWEIPPGAFLSNRGLAIPKLRWDWSDGVVGISFAVGIVVAIIVGRLLRRRRIATGSTLRAWPWRLLAVAVPTILAVAVLHPQLAVDLPEKSRFRINGGALLTPEFVALLLGLALSTSAGIAEIVRTGILAVGRGQAEAATSLGLGRLQALRLVVMPQAFHVIIPPLTSSYLTLFKNSSLAIAIGYPDFVMVSNMALTQTGQAVEIVAILVLVYLAASSVIALAMNWYHRRIASYS